MAGDSGFGSFLKRGDSASPEAFTAIARCRAVSGPDLHVAQDIDVSDHDDEWMDFVPGMLNAGEITLDLNYDHAQTTHANLKTDLYARTVRNWQLLLSTGDTITCSGYVKRLGPEAPHDGRLSAQVVIKFTGEPTFA